tara:strand:+ start:2070 stop:2384 length:315 start_codon:yes stop_codon:yes gene_type:complete
MENIELDELLVSLLFDPAKRDRINSLIPNVLQKVSKDLEIPLLYMDYCKILSRNGTTVSFIKQGVPESQVTAQSLIVSLLVVFEESKLIDIKGTLQDYIMEKIS